MYKKIPSRRNGDLPVKKVAGQMKFSLTVTRPPELGEQLNFDLGGLDFNVSTLCCEVCCCPRHRCPEKHRPVGCTLKK